MNQVVPTSGPPALRERIDAAQRRLSVVAGVGLALAALGALLDREQFFRSYVTAFLFVLSVPLGSLGLTMLHHMTGGAWGIGIRRLTEAALRTLPLVALLFLPLLAGLWFGDLYPWSDAEKVAHDPLLQHKSAWLNPAFFTVRAAVMFALWLGLGFALLRLAERHDRTGAEAARDRLRALSGPGLAVYGVTMTFAAFDWAMSLEPHWFSTIYGLIFVVGQVLTTLCFAIVLSAWLARSEIFARYLKIDVFHDLGNLLFAFVLLWAYAGLSQFLIIWHGNLAEETPWFLRRSAEGWKGVVTMLIALHFFVPFALLLARKVKRRVRLLAAVAAGLLVLRIVDLTWLIVPAFEHEGLLLHWLDVVLPIALAATWLAYYLSRLKGRPLLSLQDASIQGLFETGFQRVGGHG